MWFLFRGGGGNPHSSSRNVDCSVPCLLENTTTLLACSADMDSGMVGDMAELGITESLRCKRQMLVSAAEAAEMILRVDDIIKATPRRREPDHGH